MQLFQHEGITPGIRRAFVVYLAGHNRPVHEVLFPNFRDIQHEYRHNFEGMTAEPVPLDALLAARERMVRELQQQLDDKERRFLMSLVIRWKLQNLAKLRRVNAKKFAEQADTLAGLLAGAATVGVVPEAPGSE